MRSNLRYGKNQKREDVKSHHYIISFDPRDGPDNGLTVDKAQELGERFCREQFPGHQAIVCTHPDGHNQSGNIHVHIVINSLRIENVPLLPYMDRPADTKAGCKHRCTDAAMEHFRAEVMELCQGADHEKIRHLLADVLDDYRENALLLEQSAEGCRSPAVAELAGVQRDYSKRMEELLRDRLPRLMHGEEDPQEERAEAAALFAEYAIDFAAQGVRSALLAALAAMDQQMNCEEQQGKEHPV